VQLRSRVIRTIRSIILGCCKNAKHCHLSPIFSTAIKQPRARTANNTYLRKCAEKTVFFQSTQVCAQLRFTLVKLFIVLLSAFQGDYGQKVTPAHTNRNTHDLYVPGPNLPRLLTIIGYAMRTYVRNCTSDVIVKWICIYPEHGCLRHRIKWSTADVSQQYHCAHAHCKTFT